MPVTYPQLDDFAHALLAARLTEIGGNKAALARELEMSRSAVSQALSRSYPGDVRRIRARIVERYAEGVSCPHLACAIPPSECRAHRERPLSASSGSREAVKHWQACQACPQNPGRRGAAS